MKYIKQYELFGFGKKSLVDKKNIQLLIDATVNFFKDVVLSPEEFKLVRVKKQKSNKIMINNQIVDLKPFDPPLGVDGEFYITINRYNTIEFLNNKDFIMLKIFFKEEHYDFRETTDLEKDIAQFLRYICEKNNFERVKEGVDNFTDIGFYLLKTMDDVNNYVESLNKEEFEFFKNSQKYNL